jgi:hypothetical protein
MHRFTLSNGIDSENLLGIRSQNNEIIVSINSILYINEYIVEGDIILALIAN